MLKRDLTRLNNSLRGNGPRDVRSEGIVPIGDNTTDGGQESIPVATRDADVTTIDESVVGAAGAIRGSIKNPKNSKNYAEALDDGMGSAQKNWKTFRIWLLMH